MPGTRHSLRSALIMAAAGAGLVALTARAQNAPPAGAAATVRDENIEEIVITGLRASLEKSLEMKKQSAVLQDSINALELGRFPDADVADSLSHLPGITISRTTGGEGLRINVQGLGPAYNLVTLNNRILATDDDGRELAFDVLPSEVISGADVLKSPQASALEGSIGGTVNLRTASAFDKAGLHGGIHAEGDYNSMSHLHGNKFSAFVTDTNADQTMGFLLAAVHSQANVRTDSLNAFNQNIYGPMTYPFPFTGSANTVPLDATPCCITFGSVFDKKKRDAISGSFEWRPNSQFSLVADGLYTRLRDPQISYNQSYYFAADDQGNPWDPNAIYSNGLITGLTSNNFQPEMVNNTTDRQVNTTLLGLKATWNASDRFSMSADVYRSKADRPEGGLDTFVTAGLVSSKPDAEDVLVFKELPNSLPSINVLVPSSQLGLAACPSGTDSTTNPGYCSYTALMNSGALNDNKYWSTHYVGLNGYSVQDKVTGFTLDGSYKIGAGWLDKAAFGVGESRREKGRQDISNDWTNGSVQYGTLYNTFGCNVQCNPYSFASQGFNVISMINPPNFMQGAGGSYPTTLPQLDAAQLMAFLRSLDGKQNPLFCTQPATPPSDPAVDCAPNSLFNFANTLPQANPFNSYDVTEKTHSIYGELQFAGMHWSGNLGVRVVRTSTTAFTHVAVPVSLWTNDPNPNSTVSYNVQYSTTAPVATEGHYTLVLPSLNLSYWAVPEAVQLRLAVAKTMSRPNLSYFAPTSQNNALNGDPSLTYNGTSGLRPVTATQANLSVEWYYRPHSALTLALFDKNIRDDIYTAVQTNVDLGTIRYTGGAPGTAGAVAHPFLWTVTAPVNGVKSEFYGVELAWQHIMDNGFGVHMQYTRTQNKSYDQSGAEIGAINAVPPTTVSIGLIYEKGPWSADVNWDYQDKYEFRDGGSTDVPGWPAISDPFRWVTASAHYKITDKVQVYLEGKNLTNSVARTYLNGNPLLPWAPGQSIGQSASGVGAGYTAYGRFFTLGASYQF
jgi:iron complex outermembrane recepter protein